MANEKVIIEIGADGSRVSAELAKVQQQLSELSGAIGKADSALKSAFQIGGFSAGSAGLVQIGRQLVDVAKQFENARNLLQVSSGSAAQAGQDLDFVRNVSQRLGLELQTAASSFARLQASAIGSGATFQDIRRLFETQSRALSALGADADKIGGTFNALGQILSKQSVQLEELSSQLGDRLPGALSLAARGLTNGNVPELLERINKRLVSGVDFIRAWSDELEKTFGESNTNGIQNNLNRLNTALQEFANTLATAFKVPQVVQGWATLIADANDEFQAFMGRDTLNNIGRVNDAIEEQQKKLAAASTLLKSTNGQLGKRQFDEATKELDILTQQQKLLQQRLFEAQRAPQGTVGPASSATPTTKPAPAARSGSTAVNRGASNDPLQILRAESQTRVDILQAEQAKLDALRDLELAQVADNARKKFEVEQRFLLNTTELQKAALQEQIALASAETGQFKDSGDLAQARAKLAKAELDLATAREISTTKLRELQQIEQNRQEAEFKAALDADALRKDQAVIDDAKKKTKELSDEARQFGFAFSSAFSDAIVRGREFGDVLQGLATDIAQVVLKAAILNPLEKGISGLVSNILPFANGGVMGATGSVPLNFYANGGITTTPQLFATSENFQPEAIVPLPDGRSIPVKMQGGGVQVIINNYSRGNVSAESATGANGQEQLLIVVRDTVRQLVRSGSLDAELEQGGFSRRGTGRA